MFQIVFCNVCTSEIETQDSFIEDFIENNYMYHTFSDYPVISIICGVKYHGFNSISFSFFV